MFLNICNFLSPFQGLRKIFHKIKPTFFVKVKILVSSTPWYTAPRVGLPLPMFGAFFVCLFWCEKIVYMKSFFDPMNVTSDFHLSFQTTSFLIKLMEIICPPYFGQGHLPNNKCLKVRLFAAKKLLQPGIICSLFHITISSPWMKALFLVDTYLIQTISNLYWNIGIAGPKLKIELLCFRITTA